MYSPSLPLLSLLLGVTSAQINLPAPSGPYAVYQSNNNLTDHNRKDPYVPSSGNRNVMLSVFTPVSPRSCAQTCASPYMPPKAAAYLNADAEITYGIPQGTYASITTNLCCKVSTSSSSPSDYPLVLFSPGLGGSRLLYHYLAATISSHGYIVATIDHPYESPAIEYPDGTLVPALNGTFFDPRVPGALEKALAVRVADGRFVINQFSKLSVVKTFIPNARDCSINTKRVGFFGHSFGGATALAAAAADSRIIAGANLDGTQYGDVKGLRRDQSVLFFGRAAPNSHNHTDDATWVTGYAAAKGWKKIIGLKESAHNTFGDVPILLKTAGWPLSDELKEFVGGLDGARSFEVIQTYVRSFLGLALKGKKTKLFDGENKEYPEVVVFGGK